MYPIPLGKEGKHIVPIGTIWHFLCGFIAKLLGRQTTLPYNRIIYIACGVWEIHICFYQANMGIVEIVSQTIAEGTEGTISVY